MKALLPLLVATAIFAQNNSTEANNSIQNVAKESNHTSENNSSIKESNLSTQNDNSLTQKNLKEQIEREKKYQQEQKFYQGDDYNLKEHEVDKESVDKVPLIEPEYDFDITDLYAD
jgi:Ni/Co efflux regulator RcnB